MPIGKKELMAKAKGFILSIEKMDSKQRAATPRGEFGEDYNSLNSLVGKLFPDLEPVLPPRVSIERDSSFPFTESPYDEIRTYCEQIYQILAEQGG